MHASNIGSYKKFSVFHKIILLKSNFYIKKPASKKETGHKKTFSAVFDINNIWIFIYTQLQIQL